jgi:hypothetical protein
MSWRNITLLLAGVVLTGLGGLWFLQGADVVHIRPILCAADCKPVTGGSAAWMIAGLIALAGIATGARHLHRAPE